MSWPRVAATCQYQGAVRFEDVLDIALRVTNLGSSSITYGFRFTHRGRQIAEGEIVAVCCRMEPGTPRAIPIPAPVAERLAEARDRQDGQPAGDAE
jgi:4-hydroxybenzoyl-CoA thioesterase/acyl-CoA thioester hydrolase